MLQIRKVSNHGTSNPIVSRLSIQTQELIQFCNTSKENKVKVFELYNLKVQRRLLECDKIYREIKEETIEVRKTIAKNGFNIQSGGRSIHVPQIIRLDERVESFLYSAKLTLRDLAIIFNILFEKDFDNEARYDNVYKWAEDCFGSESNLFQLVKGDHDIWIRKIISMRNAVEHPEGRSGILHIHNLELVTLDDTDNYSLIEPTWCLNSDDRVSIIKDMDTFVSNMLEFSEDLLVTCITTKGIPEMLRLVKIAEDERQNECANRYRFCIN